MATNDGGERRATEASTAAAAAAAPKTAWDDAAWAQSRLSLPDPIRIPLAATAAFAVGMGLGAAQGSTMAGMRFRAEHAHKLPQTTTGWYLYHKSKNYHVAHGGIREGLKMGARVTVWTTAMFAIETLFDKYRGQMDLANTVLASVTVAGGFSLWNRFPLATAARTTKTALLVGLAYGGVQDLASVLRGRPVSYVDFVKKRFRRAGAGDVAPPADSQQEHSL
ncbi:hypothetical protein CMQ_6021 [Grosmannia clavigera kw1407]|uniref:Uncharacterized protein n=1 Tax=Grosmannia clavigera (strain kw1407 / UAMH 11150) TaxID=655863 RepID=F0XMR0_GROCL|nr:uncharacterized protein CMQ_6021 [Grosmannia clavigera kw1407]EFX01079.1 hypothetical protein CMQ_6021 [Grosmannia clavigera kw1407]